MATDGKSVMGTVFTEPLRHVRKLDHGCRAYVGTVREAEEYDHDLAPEILKRKRLIGTRIH